MRVVSRTARGMLLLWVVCGVAPTFAHDPAISEVRLIEETPGSYRLEVDTPAHLAGAFARPILPDRFPDGATPEYVGQSGYLTLRFRFANPETPLRPADRLLLPWDREGAAVTALWADGGSRHALFLRDAAGIRVEVDALWTVARPPASLVRQQLVGGLRHLGSGWVHPLLALSLVLASGGVGWFRAWLALPAGHAVSMVLSELTRFAPPAGLVELLSLSCVLLLLRASFRNRFAASRWVAPLFLLALAQGLDHADLLRGCGVTATELPAGMLAFHTALDALQLLLAGSIAIGLRRIPGTRMRRVVRGSAAMAAGAASVAFAWVLTVEGGGHGLSSSDGTPGTHSLPLISLALWVVGLALWLAVRRGPRVRHVRSIATGCLLLGLLVYPFARQTAPFSLGARPTTQEAARVLEELLSNVYHAFDLGEENAVYDRLARSVTGEELTEIYLQARRTLELEERGGATGRTEALDLVEIRSIGGERGGSFAVDAVWVVRGSVRHFGHAHYRQNRIHAVVSIVPVDRVWKIRRIRIIDEQRVS